MGQDEVCSCTEKHQEHLCVLRSRGLVIRIKQLTDNPDVVCGNCGELANAEENVCLPGHLFI